MDAHAEWDGEDPVSEPALHHCHEAELRNIGLPMIERMDAEHRAHVRRAMEQDPADGWVGHGLHTSFRVASSTISKEEDAEVALLKRMPCYVPAPVYVVDKRLRRNRAPQGAVDGSDIDDAVSRIGSAIHGFVKRASGDDAGSSEFANDLTYLIMNCPLLIGRRGERVARTEGGIVFAGGLPCTRAGTKFSSDIDVFVVAPTEEKAKGIQNAFCGWVESVVAPLLKRRISSASNEGQSVDYFLRSVDKACKGTKTRKTTEFELPIIRMHADTEKYSTLTQFLHLQLVTEWRRSIAAVLASFDMWACGAAFDGVRMHMQTAYVRSVRHGMQVLRPEMDRGGRGARRLIKYATRFGLGLVIPGWSPRVLNTLRELMMPQMVRGTLSKFCSHMRGAAAFSLAYLYYEMHGCVMPASDGAGNYDFDPASSSQSSSQHTPIRFPVPFDYGSDATARRQGSESWIDGKLLTYMIWAIGGDDAGVFFGVLGNGDVEVQAVVDVVAPPVVP